jgi:hypothetical protein
MFLISILLFWLPVIGPFLAGYIGGKKAGSVENALLAVFLPAIIVGALIFAFSALLLGLPLIGFLFALGGVAASLIHVGPLLVGAIIGGATA